MATHINLGPLVDISYSKGSNRFNGPHITATSTTARVVIPLDLYNDLGTVAVRLRAIADAIEILNKRGRQCAYCGVWEGAAGEGSCKEGKHSYQE